MRQVQHHGYSGCVWAGSYRTEISWNTDLQDPWKLQTFRTCQDTSESVGSVGICRVTCVRFSVILATWILQVPLCKACNAVYAAVLLIFFLLLLLPAISTIAIGLVGPGEPLENSSAHQPLSDYYEHLWTSINYSGPVHIHCLERYWKILKAHKGSKAVKLPAIPASPSSQICSPTHL